jgi:hypothetical protein
MTRWAAGTAFLLALTLMTTALGLAATRQVVADPGLEASPSHKFWWGDAYRDVWTTPIEVEVLDLRKEGGGLEIVRQVGGMQTPGARPQGGRWKVLHLPVGR